jgi:hypothetical protein
MIFEVGTVRSELFGRARSHEDGLFIGPPLDRGAGEVPLKARGYAAGFGNVAALDCRGA